MNISILRATHIYLIILAIVVLFLLASCNAGFLTQSAQGAIGGVGAGLSEYQK